MSLKANPLRLAVACGIAALLAAVIVTPAGARVVIGFGFGVPVVPGPWYYAPPPVVYAPPPVVYTPPPVVVAPAPPAYVSQPTRYWYYCDHPRGYYPYVTSCSHDWRQVPAQPSGVPH